jgi:hypothetical protein
VAGASAFGGGLLAIATGAILETVHGRAGRELASFTGDSDSYKSQVQVWRDGRMPPYAFAITGAALGAVGAGLLAAGDAQVPMWLSATSAAAGVGLFSWGIASLAKSGPCSDQLSDQRDCAITRDKGERGAILMISAVPLLGLPAALLIRRIAVGPGERGSLSRLRISPTAELGGGGFRAGVHVAWF